MATIGFYHLTRTSLEKALPQLLSRTLAAGHRAVILSGDPGKLASLDNVLWEVPDWLPHGTEQSGDADLQPIWLTAADEAPNGAQYLFLVYGGQSERLDQFERVFDLFDGNDPASVEAARLRWQAAKAAGHALTYWQQGNRGWEAR
ncbi:MAG: DNA polymerase III subunit chi [Acetobacteraceae bacterium]|nr:DNA polymerase III subunit chi [Acetobacteraceae bacterium]MBV8523850.1 DNA polymerase III subunit chi [Acetobacteraceae bacterium]MBV8591972.1 DNA polymerase III subunit chi [Acetobacteraceae bacterium]